MTRTSANTGEMYCEQTNACQRQFCTKLFNGDCRLSQLTHAHFTLSSLQVRVFTYLIGREMTFADNVKWIACNNKGKKTKQNQIWRLIIRLKVRESAL